MAAWPDLGTAAKLSRDESPQPGRQGPIRTACSRLVSCGDARSKLPTRDLLGLPAPNLHTMT